MAMKYHEKRTQEYYGNNTSNHFAKVQKLSLSWYLQAESLSSSFLYLSDGDGRKSPNETVRALLKY